MDEKHKTLFGNDCDAPLIEYENGFGCQTCRTWISKDKNINTETIVTPGKIMPSLGIDEYNDMIDKVDPEVAEDLLNLLSTGKHSDSWKNDQ